jgi:hypothetical protein
MYTPSERQVTGPRIQSSWSTSQYVVGAVARWSACSSYGVVKRSEEEEEEEEEKQTVNCWPKREVIPSAKLRRGRGRGRGRGGRERASDADAHFTRNDDGDCDDGWQAAVQVQCQATKGSQQEFRNSSSSTERAKGEAGYIGRHSRCPSSCLSSLLTTTPFLFCPSFCSG